VGGVGGLRQSAALYPGEVLAHRVELVYAGAGSEQEVRHGLLVGKGHALRGGREKRRAASGDEKEGKHCLVGVLKDPQDPLRRRVARLVRYGVSRLEDLHVAVKDNTMGVAVLRKDDPPGVDLVVEFVHGRLRHGGRALAEGDDLHLRDTRLPAHVEHMRHMLPHGPPRINSPKPCPENINDRVSSLFRRHSN